MNKVISPSELKEAMTVSQFESDLQDEVKRVDKKIREALANGDIKILIQPLKLENLFYQEEKLDALAQRLIQLGYNCKRESNVVGGVLKSPAWYLYFT